MTAPGSIPDLFSIVGIIFRNAGDNTVQINNGRWTLDSKETLSINVTEPGGVMDITGWIITFDADGPTNTSKLQVIIVYPSSIPPC